ncbi:DUF6173 family protein [Winogradskyella ludwigii]|jgi:hypothetical protein|uniref:DUF6173 family protein n=1 Tax=Winogradskyella ludwigii TaxID=2686076 RepID=UPI0015CB6F4C|nr:DUF6173 family protein [Winogradskyella ludwigii]
MSLDKIPQFNFPKIEPMIPNLPIINKEEPYLAGAYYERLAKYIIEFEKDLTDSEEVGAKLVSFGESIIIHVEDLGYWNPRLICFYGTDSKGQKVQLIQHVNQISILLIKLKRIPERTRIGYKLSQELDELKNKEE